MKCPICNLDLQMTERQNVEIDYCPQCRGVWLDRGELDKIIEKSGTTEKASFQNHHDIPVTKHHEKDHYHEQHYYKKKRRKESFLEDLFDF